MKKYLSVFLSSAIIALVLLFANSQALAQSRIYGVSGGSLVYFDYVTGEYDNVPTGFGFPNPNLSFGCTMDPYNGTYFYHRHPLSHSSIVSYIDLNTILPDITSSIFENPNLIEYNCLNNTLLFQAVDGDFYSYDIENRILRLLSSLTPASGIIYGQTRTYSPFKNHYFNQRHSDQVYFDIIDGFTGKLVFSQPAPNGFISSPVVDYHTGNYYGVKNDTVILFDPLSDYKLPIVAFPFNHVQLNNQMAVYDQNSSKYIIPSLNQVNDIAYFVVVDVIQSVVDTVIEQPNRSMNWHRIYSKPKSILTQIGDSLICSNGLSYLWFYNDDAIPNCSSNVYKPYKSGMYKVRVQYSTYSNTSSEINYIVTRDPKEKTLNKLTIYPNPASDRININFTRPDHNPIIIEIFDAFGKKVFETRVFDDEKIINISNFPQGLYIIMLKTTNSNTMKRFVKY